MCTLSVIAHAAGGYRVVCNRDEAHDRAAAAPPRWHAGPSRAIWPVDALAGGTWIGANERGMTLALVNLNPEPAAMLPGRDELRSRGGVIPELIGAPDAVRAVEGAGRLPLRRFAPFRLIAIELSPAGPRAHEFAWDRVRARVGPARAVPACFVSSGLGDSRVSCRLALFEEMVVNAGGGDERQDAFHAHAWPDRPEVSVRMCRRDARTVSVTTVEVVPAPAKPSVSMAYEPVPAPSGAVPMA